MDTGKSVTYNVEITLITESGDLPNLNEVEDLIAAQMSGALDDNTGLFCGCVTVLFCDPND